MITQGMPESREMNEEYSLTKMSKLGEKIAGRIIVDCGYGSEYPCPHAYPDMGYKKCPHLDEDICMWQREQADQILKEIREEIKKCELTDAPMWLPDEYYRKCADEDGAIQKYRLRVDKLSYLEGTKAQLQKGLKVLE